MKKKLYKSKDWIHIATVALLILNIILSVFVRVQDTGELQGKYMSGGDDSYFYYRQAKVIVANGRLPDRDYMQNFPDGLDLRVRQNLNCYAIAYLYKFIRIFAPEISIEKVAIYYPVLCFVLILLVCFGLVNLFLDKPTSLLAVTFLATIPAAVFRTHAGWADRDALSLLTWLICIYFYVAAHQTAYQSKRYLLWAILSGVAMGAKGLTWPGVGLLSIIIIAFNAVKLFTRTYRRQEFYIYLCWYIPSISIMLIFTRGYSDLHSPYTLTAIVLPTAFAVVAGVDVLIRQLESQFAPKILWGMLAVSFLILLFVGSSYTKLIIERFLHPAGTDLVIKYVGEFQVPGLFTWFTWYQLFIVFPLLGMLLVIYRLSKTYGVHAKLLTVMLAVTIAVTIFSGIVPETQQRFAEIVYVGSIILLIGTMVLSYFPKSFKGEAHIRKDTDALLLLFIWSLLTLFYTRGAVRFALFLAPPAVILGAYAIVFILKRVYSQDENRILNLAILTTFMVLSWQLRTPCCSLLLKIGLNDIISSLFCLNLSLVSVIFCALLGLKEFSAQQTKPMVTKVAWIIFSMAICLIAGGFPYVISNWPAIKVLIGGPASDELRAFNWIKDNTPPKSVIAAWWNSGSRIEAIAERATIIDQQHNLPLIHQMAREVFCAETVDEALKFLESRKATHLLIMPDEVFFMLRAISVIGSTQDMDRKILVKTFRLDEEASKSANWSQGGFSERRFPLRFLHSNSLGYTTEQYRTCYKKDPGTERVEIQYKLDGIFHKASIFLNGMNISPKYVLFDDKRYEDVEGSGGLLVTSVNVHNPFQSEPIESKHAVYFDEKACKQLAFTVVQYLRSCGVGASIHFDPPVHLQPYYLNQGTHQGKLSVTERLAEELITLPMYPDMTEADHDWVIHCLKTALKKAEIECR